MKSWCRCCPLFLLLLLTGVTSAGETEMTVQVRQTQLRASASFLGRVEAPVVYGDRVVVLQQTGDWAQVTLRGTPGTEGWIHLSALTEKELDLKATGADLAAHSKGDEIALAGKGFNKTVENAFRRENPQADFSWVDKMEAFAVSPEEMDAFRRKGRQAREGGDSQ